MNSRELPELAAQLNMSVDELNQVMNISLNTSKVFELCVNYFVVCTVFIFNCHFKCLVNGYRVSGMFLHMHVCTVAHTHTFSEKPGGLDHKYRLQHILYLADR